MIVLRNRAVNRWYLDDAPTKEAQRLNVQRLTEEHVRETARPGDGYSGRIAAYKAAVAACAVTALDLNILWVKRQSQKGI